jgi:Cytochrome bd terminal oxidase subunit I
MFGLTALELARIQFAFTMSSHIIFPATTIGLASYLVALEGLWLWKKDTTYRDLYHSWSHIFAVNFAMGYSYRRRQIDLSRHPVHELGCRLRPEECSQPRTRFQRYRCRNLSRKIWANAISAPTSTAICQTSTPLALLCLSNAIAVRLLSEDCFVYKPPISSDNLRVLG